jgi:hypothetical protein
MPNHLHLAAALLLIPGAAPAQIHSPQVNLHRREKPEDLSWTWQYTDPPPTGRESQLLHDPRLKPFLTRDLTAPQSFWGDTSSLPSTADTALAFLAVAGKVLADDNRYLTADGAVQDLPTSRGQLFLDLNPARPLLIFSAIDWIRDSRSTDDPTAGYTLWIFPSRILDPSHIPAAFTRSITLWTATPPAGSKLLQNITHVILVDPDGQPHAVPPASVGAHTTLAPDKAEATS